MTKNVLRCLLLSVVAAAVTGVSSVSAQESPADRDSSIIIQIEATNRNYPDWREEWQVRLGESFYLGDSRFTAIAERFVPDFRINDQGEVLNYSDQMNNPAAQIVVYGDSAATDTTWAFKNFPPHFSPRSFFAFKLMSIKGFEPSEENDGSSEAAPGSTSAAQKKEEDDG